MPEFDFRTINAVFGVILGPSVIVIFKDVFEKPAEPATLILKALAGPVTPGKVWMQNRRKDVINSIFSIPRILLSFFFFSMTVIVGVIVAVGPERIFDPSRWGALAEPLTTGEKVIYDLLLVPTVAVYIWRVSLPVWKGWRAVISATCWLRNKAKTP